MLLKIIFQMYKRNQMYPRTWYWSVYTNLRSRHIRLIHRYKSSNHGTQPCHYGLFDILPVSMVTQTKRGIPNRTNLLEYKNCNETVQTNEFYIMSWCHSPNIYQNVLFSSWLCNTIKKWKPEQPITVVSLSIKLHIIIYIFCFFAIYPSRIGWVNLCKLFRSL